MPSSARALAALWVLLAAAACARMQPIPVRTPPATPGIDTSELSVGDFVEVVTKGDQKKIGFTITEVDDSRIKSFERTIATEEIQSISVRRRSLLPGTPGSPNSSGALGAIAGAVVGVLVLILVL